MASSVTAVLVLLALLTLGARSTGTTCTNSSNPRPLPANLSFSPQNSCYPKPCSNDGIAICHRGTDRNHDFERICVPNTTVARCHLANHYDGLPKQTINNVTCDCDCDCVEVVPSPSKAVPSPVKVTPSPIKASPSKAPSPSPTAACPGLCALASCRRAHDNHNDDGDDDDDHRGDDDDHDNNNHDNNGHDNNGHDNHDNNGHDNNDHDGHDRRRTNGGGGSHSGCNYDLVCHESSSDAATCWHNKSNAMPGTTWNGITCDCDCNCACPPKTPSVAPSPLVKSPSTKSPSQVPSPKAPSPLVKSPSTVPSPTTKSPSQAPSPKAKSPVVVPSPHVKSPPPPPVHRCHCHHDKRALSVTGNHDNGDDDDDDYHNDPDCIPLNCTEICPNGGHCNATLDECDCDPCPPRPDCDVSICHVTHSTPTHVTYMFKVIPCDLLDIHLAHGDALPNSIVNGSYLDEHCHPTNEVLCVNGTNHTCVPCSCDANETACTSPVCDAQCPNSGICNATTGACVCDDCPPALPVCDCLPGDSTCLPLNCSAVCPHGGECNPDTHICKCNDCPPVPSCNCNEGQPGCIFVPCGPLCAPLEGECDAETGTCVCHEPPCNSTTSCNCDPNDPLCVYVNCTLQCPNGGSCNMDSGVCECERCANHTAPCKVPVCHFPHNNTEPQLVNVSCNHLAAHLEHGDVLPGTIKDDVFYDDDCHPHPVVCINGSIPPPLCDCLANDTSCTPVNCSAVCPNGGECDAITHQCKCEPCHNCTTLPSCDCNPAEDPFCTPVNCTAQCPHGGWCDHNTHLCHCDDCPHREPKPCNLTICCAPGKPELVNCSALPWRLAQGQFFPDSVVNGVHYDNACNPVNETCINGTVPLCDCEMDALVCESGICEEQCPNHGYCNATTHQCVCDDCPPDANNTEVCNTTLCSTDTHAPVVVACGKIPEAIGSGLFFYPGSVVDGVLYDANCTATNASCSNVTHHECDCDQDDPLCQPVDCGLQCPNGGECVNHVCVCNPCVHNCSECQNCSRCRVHMCHIAHRDDDCEKIVSLTVNCSQIHHRLRQGDFFPGGVYNGSVYDDHCRPIPNETCINGTVPPPCHCDPNDPDCVAVNCTDYCPNGGYCNLDTQLCHCEECAPPTHNGTKPCNVTMCKCKDEPVLVNCSQIPHKLEHGFFFPDSVVNGTHYDDNCAPIHEICVNHTLPPSCDCDPNDPNCIHLNCTIECPNGGYCNTDFHTCHCYPCLPSGHHPCNVTMCSPDHQLVVTNCSGVPFRLKYGFFFPNGTVDGVHYDANCQPLNETCINGTVPPVLCECDMDAEVCESSVCEEQCPNHGYCNATTHSCVCDDCPPGECDPDCRVTLCVPTSMHTIEPMQLTCAQVQPALVGGAFFPGAAIGGVVYDSQCHPTGDICSGPCSVSVCHFPPGNPDQPILLDVSCASLPAHLAHGDVLPNSTVNGTFYDVNCTGTPEVCINTTTPPELCDCNDTSLVSCLPLDCEDECPNGGSCNTTTHACECDPCDSQVPCNVTVCHHVLEFPELAFLEVINCSALPAHLAVGDVLPNSTVNGTFYGLQCETEPVLCVNNTSGNVTCFNSTVPPPLCDCNETEIGSCVPLDCALECPNGGSCNTTTHTCDCEPCDPNGCMLPVCHHTENAPNGWELVFVDCSQLPELLESGDVLPNTTVGDVFYTSDCVPVPVVCFNDTGNITCVNGTVPPPLCDCNDTNTCTPLDCTELCPNGGMCDNVTHTCICDPCECERLPSCDCNPDLDSCCFFVNCTEACPNGGECDAQTHACVCSECSGPQEDCNIPICFFSGDPEEPYGLSFVPCSSLPELLAGGSVLPNTTINGTLYVDEQCIPHNVTCTPNATEPRCGDKILDPGEECDSSLYCTRDCKLLRPFQYCLFLNCSTPVEDTPDTITWMLQNCVCMQPPVPPPDNLETPCDETQQFIDDILCPSADFTTPGIWILLWFLFLVLVALILTILGAAAR